MRNGQQNGMGSTPLSTWQVGMILLFGMSNNMVNAQWNVTMSNAGQQLAAGTLGSVGPLPGVPTPKQSLLVGAGNLKSSQAVAIIPQAQAAADTLGSVGLLPGAPTPTQSLLVGTGNMKSSQAVAASSQAESVAAIPSQSVMITKVSSAQVTPSGGAVTTTIQGDTVFQVC
ncbi:hypothetical protein PVAR5_2757 [Paecilomyces variotii No. 5]|uniref:Uncharacterized protein n=1 Tax=Byssochlamys spectabilis (strain No. 5 / NBRC 109023) TaxID=1356009 RepID=V5FWL6_BYSSN|nr:hypothetical protein PVAR5_2757 [Paecilomyces variotii No. 5]